MKILTLVLLLVAANFSYADRTVIETADGVYLVEGKHFSSHAELQEYLDSRPSDLVLILGSIAGAAIMCGAIIYWSTPSRIYNDT